MTPTSARAIIIELPPWLTKTSGTPVKGKMPSMEAMLIND
jgi:hypothetical protein